MPELELEQGSIALDDEGHLKDFSQWTEEVARHLAEREGIELGEDHLRVVRLIQEFYARHEVAPMLTHVSKESGFSYKELHKLFGKQPGKRAAKLAGLPKATGCT